MLESNLMSTPTPDEINRLWQHGLHEERLFHDRLNYFSAMQIGLLGVFGIMYNKESSLGVFLPLTLVALLFTLLWLAIQVRHWRYCVHVTAQIKKEVPEYARTVAGFAAPGRTDGLSISRPQAFAMPVLFALTWMALFGWTLLRPGSRVETSSWINLDRVLLVLAIVAIVWLAWRVQRLERRLQSAHHAPP